MSTKTISTKKNPANIELVSGKKNYSKKPRILSRHFVRGIGSILKIQYHDSDGEKIAVRIIPDDVATKQDRDSIERDWSNVFSDIENATNTCLKDVVIPTSLLNRLQEKHKWGKTSHLTEERSTIMIKDGSVFIVPFSPQEEVDTNTIAGQSHE